MLFLLLLLSAFSMLPSSALEPEEIWDRVNPSVLRIEATHLDGEVVTGSGFVCEVGGKMRVLSNRHVVKGAKTVRVGQTGETLVPAPGYQVSPTLDLAIIELPPTLRLPVLKTRTTEVRTGENVYAIGFPLGLGKSITQGLISSQTAELFQFNAPISSGSSGGPLVDKNGMVIGVVTAGSRNSETEIAQNLNFGIKAAVIPKLNLFEDPIVSFYDAWLELVKIESRMLSELEEHKVLDIHAYLLLELQYAMALSSGKISPLRRKEADEAMSEARANAKSQLLPMAAKTVKFLLKQDETFETIPRLFLGLGRQALLNQFTRDERPGGLFRLDIEEKEIVPLLKVSLEHSKARYEDVAYQIEYLSSILTQLQKGDSQLLDRLSSLKQGAQREEIRLNYEGAGKLDSEERLRLFIQSLFPYNAANFDITILERRTQRKLSAAEEFSAFGGFEHDILTMFQRLSISELQRSGPDKAIAYLLNEITHRKFGDYRLLAHFKAGAGMYEQAYSAYEKAFSTAHKINVFTLEQGAKLSRYLIVDELSDDGTRFTSYPDRARKNLMGFHDFLQKKPPFLLVSLPTIDEAMATKLFTMASEFEQYIVLHVFSDRARMKVGAWQNFIESISADPIAASIYAKYF